LSTDHRTALAKIRRFDQLIAYLRDEMGWPIARDSFEDVDDLFYDFTADELGIDPKTAAKIESIKRLRPLSPRQPWGIFFVKFEPKKLPVVALRRILSQVALKKRASANSAERTAWAADDLLFVSNYGEGDERQISFAHFSKPADGHDLPTLKVLGWDNLDTALHLDTVAKELTEQLAWPEDDADVEAWRQGWRAAFTLRHREVITTSKDLSIRLAELARAIRDRIKTALAIETKTGPLTKLMKAFQEALVHDLDADGFADMYAQTIAYGLLSARIADPHKKTADDFAAHMRTNPFLRELMETFLRVGGRRGKAGGPGIDFDELGVSEVIQLLDDANMEAVVRDFGDRNPQEDPVIHFYELFLKEYDAKKRMQRGVFYTPRPVVSYIVRSVHELLRTEFSLEDGLADIKTWGEMAKRNKDLKIPAGVSPEQGFVQILDPATGTGTFLVEIIDLVHKTLVAKWKAQGQNEKQINALWNEYVPKHLLPRLHGYELLMAPYAIAHLKIGLKLYETGYRFGSDERARIYLTNTLDPPHDFSDRFAFDMPALAHEAQAVNAIKRGQRFTVVVGNPPYAGWSANLTPGARAIVEGYKFIDGQRIREKGALQFEKNLQDDYVKFFAWSEKIVARTGFGVLCFISNNGFLETPTLRGMRWHLLDTFSRLYLLDLHGSTKRPIEDDENVFDIQQGVAISILAKGPSQASRKIVQRADVIGNREHKYAFLAGRSVGDTSWSAISPAPPFYQFLALDAAMQSEFSEYPSLIDIMPFYSSGTETGFDSLLVDFTKHELLAKIQRFLEPRKTAAEISAEFSVGEGTGRKLLEMRKAFLKDFESNGTKYCTRGMYRVFDNRVYYYKKEYLKTNSLKIMRNLLEAENLALVAFRQQSQNGFQHIFVTNELGDKNAVSLRTREINYYFPLRILPDKDTLHSGAAPALNFGGSFLAKLSATLRLPRKDGSGLPGGITPEEIFQYAYAVFHSPTYRSRYAEFLKTDFPRLPLTDSLDLFRALARIGGELVGLHLLKSGKLDGLLTEFIGGRNPEIEKVSWSNQTVWIDKGETAGFKGVQHPVWGFHIGGYQVCEKWLKDRRGRTLSKDDIAHYQKIVVALAETIRLMKGIDEVIEAHGGWAGAFVGASQAEQ
jgi:predicted helicase